MLVATSCLLYALWHTLGSLQYCNSSIVCAPLPVCTEATEADHSHKQQACDGRGQVCLITKQNSIFLSLIQTALACDINDQVSVISTGS